jgi:hypothetical protein
MKFWQKFTFTATAFLMMLEAYALSQFQVQYHTKAVMSVSAQVVSAPQLANTLATDITGQLQEDPEGVSLRNVSVILPEGGNYSVWFDPVIKMTGNTSSWDINTSVQKDMNKRGSVRLHLSGHSTTTTVAPGKYVGELTTRIEYH